MLQYSELRNIKRNKELVLHILIVTLKIKKEGPQRKKNKIKNLSVLRIWAIQGMPDKVNNNEQQHSDLEVEKRKSM